MQLKQPDCLMTGNRGVKSMRRPLEIQWINHAGFLVSTYNTRLLVDPWFEGRAFNDSWALHSPTVFADRTYHEVTELWFSHEHPDHFSLATLKRFPSDARARIRVLYQGTRDKRVIAALSRLGFPKVVELGPEPLLLEPEVSVLGPQFLHGDSWMLLQTPECSLLNLNDCNTDERPLGEIR